MSPEEPGPEAPENTPAASRTPRRMNRPALWITVGTVAAMAIAGAAVAAPLMRPSAEGAASPSTAPSASPTGEAESPSPTPSPTPTPTCTVTMHDVVWSDPFELTLPAAGPADADRVQRIERADVDYRPTPFPFPIDEESFGILTANDLRSRSSLTVAGRDGQERWTVVIDRGRLQVLSSPATTGVQGILVIGVTAFEGGDHRMMSFDLATGDVIAERETGETSPITWRAGRAWWTSVAPTTADSFYVSDRDALSRIDATSLETRWTVAGSDYGVEWFEGGVPFGVIGDRAFVGSHAVDAETGEGLGWESAGNVTSVAGATLHTRLMYDHVGPFDLSGLDLARGESCWTREVLSYTGDADTLWILTSEGAIERIDPLTGEALETVAQTTANSLRAVGRYLFATESDPDDYRQPTTVSVFEDSVLRWTYTDDSSAPPYVSGSQIVVHERKQGLDTLTGYDEPGGDPAWQIEELDIFVDEGVVLQAEVDWNENIVDYALRH